MDDDTRSLLAHRPLLAAGLAIVAVVFLVLAMARVSQDQAWGYDFAAYFQAAMRVIWNRPDEGIYVPYSLEGPFSPGPSGLYLYAPPLAVAVLPFALLASLPTAVVGWFILRLALLVIACAILPVRPAVRAMVFVVGAFSQPVLSDLALGNVSVLVVVAMAFVWRGLDRPMGSVAAAMAMSIRPTLGVLLFWWAIRRRWRPILWTLLAGLVLVLLTLPVVGIDAYLDYLKMLRNVTQVTGVANNLDLASTALRLGLDPIVATAALYAGYAIAIIATVVSLRYDRDLSFMVTISATLLLAPLLWNHYLSSLLLPAAFLAQRGRPWGLALPLLGWLPLELLPVVAIVGTLAPFLAAPRPGIDQPALDRGLPWRRRRPIEPATTDLPAVADGPAGAPAPGPSPQPVPEPAVAAQVEAAAPAGSRTTSSPG